MNIEEKALLLIKETAKALKRGTRHYRASDNKPLTTVRDIVDALVSEGEILFEPRYEASKNERKGDKK